MNDINFTIRQLKHHAIQRFKSRYNLDLTHREYCDLCAVIKQRPKTQVISLNRYHDDYEELAVLIYGNWVPVVWWCTHSIIKTVLPPEVIGKYHAKINAVMSKIRKIEPL